MCVLANASCEALEDFLDRLGYKAKTKEQLQLMKAIRSDGWQSYKRASKSKKLLHYEAVLRDLKAAENFCLGYTGSSIIPKASLSEICCRFNRSY